MKKICFKCSIEKDIEDFYKHPQMRDGHLGKCKECTKKDTKERLVLHPEIVHAYDNLRSKTPERKKSSREHCIRWAKEHPERKNAISMLHNAVRDKRIIKPLQCEICGKQARLHGHHHDYSLPLSVIWICAECHGQIQ